MLDVELGDDNGIEILPELSALANAKIIILTGDRNPAVHETAIFRGASGVLLKTESAQVILKAIQRVHDGEIWFDNRTLSHVLNQLTNHKNESGIVDRETEKIADLTAREREIIGVIVNFDSSTNKEIAARLFISSSTLKNHLTTIYSKLELKNRIDLLKFALNHKLDRP